MKTLNVVCGLIFSEDGRLFLARKAQGMPHQGKWEFPGGKIESGEEPQIALQRELLEELDMEIDVLAFLGSNIHEYPDLRVKLNAYKCRLVRFGEQLTDHDAFVWILPNELFCYDLAEADIPLAKLISKECKNE